MGFLQCFWMGFCNSRRATQMRECLDRVDDTDLQSGAQCIVNAWNSLSISRIGKFHFFSLPNLFQHEAARTRFQATRNQKPNPHLKWRKTWTSWIVDLQNIGSKNVPLITSCLRFVLILTWSSFYESKTLIGLKTTLFCTTLYNTL